MTDEEREDDSVIVELKTKTKNSVQLHTLMDYDYGYVGALRAENDKYFFDTPYMCDSTQKEWYRAVTHPDSTTRVFIVKSLSIRGSEGTMQPDLYAAHGYGMLYGIDRKHLRCSVGLCIDKDHRGAGIGTDTLALLTEYAFLRLNLNKVCAEIMANNIASLRVFQKLGYKLVGVQKQHYLKNHSWVDSALYEILWRDYRVDDTQGEFFPTQDTTKCPVVGHGEGQP